MDEQPYGGTEQAAEDSGIDLLGMDLESLRTVEHPVLAALVSDLRTRAAAPGSEALWGFENDQPSAGGAVLDETPGGSGQNAAQAFTPRGRAGTTAGPDGAVR